MTNGANGVIANSGTFTVQAGALGAQGTFNQDAGTTSGNPITINGANLNFTSIGASSFSITSSGAHLSGNIAAGQNVAINSATVTVAGPLTNAGVIQASGTGSTLNVSGGTLTNTGTIEADAGSTGPFTLSGTYDNQGAAPGGIVDNASMTLNGVTLTNEGAITVASGATLTQVAGTETNGANGAIANSGTFTVQAGALGAQGTFNQDAGTTSGNPITINGANLNFTSIGASSFSITSSGAHLSGNIAAGQNVAINSATVTVAGPLTNAGVIQASGTGSTLNVSGGTLTNTGTIEADAGSTGPFTLSGTYDNQGAAPGGIVDNASMTLNGVTLTNEGAITVASGATLTQVAGTETNGANGAIANSGTFTVQAGALGAQGTFNQDAGTTSGNPITINGANLNFTSIGASSFSITSSGAHLSGNIAAGQSVILQAGASVVVGTLTNNGSIISQATTAGTTISGSLVNNGTFELESGQATTIQGTYSQGSGGSLTVDVNGATTFGHLSVTGMVTLNGRLAVNTSGFTPTVGQSFAIISNNGLRSGQFSSYSFGSQPYTTVYNPNVVDLVVAAGLAITTTSLPDGVVGSPYPSAALAASGGTTPYSWTITSGTLPGGLTLNASTGAITGTPTGPAGTSKFTVTVTDSGVPDQTQSANLSITIDAAPTFTADSPPLTATVGTPYAYTFQATGPRTPSPTPWSKGLPPSCPSTPRPVQSRGLRLQGPPPSPTRSPPPTASPPTPPPAPSR